MWITCDGIERGRVMCGPHDEVEQGNLLPVLPGHGSSSSTEEGLLPPTGGTWWIPARRKGVRVMALMKPLPSHSFHTHVWSYLAHLVPPQPFLYIHVQTCSSLTMPQLLKKLILQAKQEGREALRQLVSALNGLAAMHIIKNEVGNT